MIEEIGAELEAFISGVCKRGTEIKDGGEPLFEDLGKQMVHPDVYSTEEEARHFAYKSDGEGIKNIAEEKRTYAYIMGDK